MENVHIFGWHTTYPKTTTAAIVFAHENGERMGGPANTVTDCEAGTVGCATPSAGIDPEWRQEIDRRAAVAAQIATNCCGEESANCN